MKPCIFLTLALTLFLCSPATSAEGGGKSRIVFLNLTLDGNDVRLDNIRVVDGTLKRHKRIRFVPSHLYFVVTSEMGEKLYEATVADPSILRVEYTDAEGNLTIKTASRDITDFAIRIPYDERAHRVTIHKIGATVAGVEQIAGSAEPMSSFVIDLTGGNK